MPFNGIGGFTLVAGNPVVTGTTISSTVQNNTMTDFANGFANCVTRDGQSAATANIPMGGFKLTGLAAGTTSGDAVRWEQAVLLTQLADTSSASNGAGLEGFAIGNAYGLDRTGGKLINSADLFDYMVTQARVDAIRAEAGAAGADCATQLQTAFDSGRGDLMAPVGRYMMAAPVRIVSGTDRVSVRGLNRIRTVFSPSAVDLSVAPVSINALFINQDNNAHFCLENARFYSSVSYTGVGIYCVEGGGSDASVQALFSGIFRNLWIDFASTNNGFLRGGLQNTIFDSITFENMKGAFWLQGTGCADNFFTNISAYNSFDSIIGQVDDTNGSALTTVNGLHVYTHNRGRALDLQNWVVSSINDVTFEAATGNLGDTGVVRLTDCENVTVGNIVATTRTGVPACAVGVEVEASKAKFTTGFINADIGLKLSGTGANDLVFENFDFTECTTAALQFAAAVTGKLITRGCKFNDSQLSGVLTSVANALNWYSYDDEFINAGLGGSAGTRNLTLESSGEIILSRPRIGQDDAGAAAAYYIAANGSGTVTLIDPIWVGTPPTGLTTGSQLITIKITQPGDLAEVTTATYTVGDSIGAVVADRAGTVTLTLPSASSYPGRQIPVKTQQAQAVVSASSNVIPATGGAAGTAILPAVDGSSGVLIAYGANWHLF